MGVQVCLVIGGGQHSSARLGGGPGMDRPAATTWACWNRDNSLLCKAPWNAKACRPVYSQAIR